MKRFAVLVVATLLVGTVLVACGGSPTAQTAEERAYAEGRRDSPDPIAPPGPPDASMIADDTSTPPPDDE